MSVGRENRAVCIGVGIFLMSRCRITPCLGISGYTEVGPIYISIDIDHSPPLPLFLPPMLSMASLHQSFFA